MYSWHPEGEASSMILVRNVPVENNKEGSMWLDSDGRVEGEDVERVDAGE